MSRKECPGCKQSFSIRYFEQHTKENFESSTRLWKCSKTEFENEPNVLQEDLDEHIDNQSSSDDNFASYRLSGGFLLPLMLRKVFHMILMIWTVMRKFGITYQSMI